MDSRLRRNDRIAGAEWRCVNGFRFGNSHGWLEWKIEVRIEKKRHLFYDFISPVRNDPFFFRM